jgi:hypothetical protein
MWPVIRVASATKRNPRTGVRGEQGVVIHGPYVPGRRGSGMAGDGPQTSTPMLVA